MTLLALLAISCVGLQGLFAGAEVALLTANRGLLDEQAQRGNAGAARALQLLAHEDRLLATCLVGSTSFAIAGVAATVALLESAPLAVSGWVPVALIVGATVPRLVHVHHATAIAPLAASYVRTFQWLFLPFLYVVEAWAKGVSAVSGSDRKTALTRAELVRLLGVSDEPGNILPEEQAMIQRVFALPETLVEACMTPLVDIDAVSADATVREAVETTVRNGHTRLPLFHERVDHIVGVAHARDLLFVADDARAVRELMRPAKFVPASKHADVLLNEMRREREPFAVVVDEYGGSIGIVTIEDILERIIGEIRDERDGDEGIIRKVGDGEWRVAARVDIETLETHLKRQIPRGDYETVAGWLLHHLGRIPRRGEVILLDDLRVRVDEANERSVSAITIQLNVGRRPTNVT